MQLHMVSSCLKVVVTTQSGPCIPTRSSSMALSQKRCIVKKCHPFYSSMSEPNRFLTLLSVDGCLGPTISTFSPPMRFFGNFCYLRMLDKFIPKVCCTTLWHPDQIEVWQTRQLAIIMPAWALILWQ